ncbi:MAG TPA: DNA repair protein RecN [Anaerolineaceae bacterium]|nr:MAG: DNA repair protein RecN [Anaerolineae bacterium 49_20]HAE85734.1 DNA repair protein RecN [Anaerolineaceae bacterium]
MLSELRIQDFAIIEDLQLQFKPGLTVFTGETGAGKSIILDALSAVLGGRVDANDIRRESDKAIIEATFLLDEPTQAALKPILEAEGLFESGQLTLAREIRAAGRNVARINGRSVNLSLQAEVGAYLTDIHGQSEHLSLLRVQHHLELLDRFAHHDALLAQYRAGYRQWRALQAELEDLQKTQQFARERTDMLTYQIQEIESARLKAGEEEELRQERTRLANAETLYELGRQALTLLDEGGTDSLPVTDLLGQVVQSLADLSRIDPQMASFNERAESALNTLADIAFELRNYLESIEFNPQRLDQIEERLNTLAFLKRKYGGSLESIQAYLDKSKIELTKVENIDEQIAQVEQKIAQIKQELAVKAAQLSAERAEAVRKLTAGIEQQLDKLRMTKAHFQVAMQQLPDPDGLVVNGQAQAFDANGIDKVEFLIETNVGEGFKPLVKIASGGETSRLMLALKSVLAEADQIPTLIFDEIDQGIGGRVGLTVGEMLWQLAREHQVMCVTHLPQLAAFGDQHLRVSKQEHAGRTTTQVEELQGTARVNELAAMLGAPSESNRRSAEELLRTVEEFTGKIRANR